MAPLSVFVSHSNEDNDFTERLVADLKSAGADVWVDYERIASGDFTRSINEGLGNCEWTVLVLTPNALASEWVRREIDAAVNLHVKKRILGVIPILAADVSGEKVPPIWDTLHSYDAVKNYDRALKGLLRAIGAVENNTVPSKLSEGEDQRVPPFVPLVREPRGRYQVGNDSSFKSDDNRTADSRSAFPASLSGIWHRILRNPKPLIAWALALMPLFFVASYVYQSFHFSSVNTFSADIGQRIDNTGSFVLRGESIKGATYDFITSDTALNKMGFHVNDEDYKATNTGGLLGMNPTSYELTIRASELGYKDGVKIIGVTIHRKFLSFLPLISSLTINGKAGRPIVTIGTVLAVALEGNVNYGTSRDNGQVIITLTATNGATFGKAADLKLIVAGQPISNEQVSSNSDGTQLNIHLAPDFVAYLSATFEVSIQITGQKAFTISGVPLPPQPPPVGTSARYRSSPDSTTPVPGPATKSSVPNIVGIWQTDNKDEPRIFDFKDDGTFTLSGPSKSPDINVDGSGTYEIKGDKVTLKLSAERYVATTDANARTMSAVKASNKGVSKALSTANKNPERTFKMLDKDAFTTINKKGVVTTFTRTVRPKGSSEVAP